MTIFNETISRSREKDLAMMIKRLAHRMRNTDPAIHEAAIDLLRRMGLEGSPLRESAAPEARRIIEPTPAMIRAGRAVPDCDSFGEAVSEIEYVVNIYMAMRAAEPETIPSPPQSHEGDK